MYELELILNKNGGSIRDYPPMPLPSPEMLRRTGNRLIREQLHYNVSIEKDNLDMYLRTLNQDQMRVFQSTTKSNERGEGGCFFIYGSGGTGKTYLWKALIAYIRSKGLIVLSVASFGISALLLPMGKTTHSMFNIPLDVNETSIC